MSIESIDRNTTPEKPTENSERNQIVEQVFEKYHKDLIYWCEFKLNLRRVGFNPRSDAEEIVAIVYERLLKGEKTIDLTRSEPEIRAYLNVCLDNAITSFVEKSKRKKTIPPENLISLDETLEKKERENLLDKLKQQFFQSANNKEELHAKIDRAIVKLEELDPKMADIIKKKYKEGKTTREIGTIYGVTRQRIAQIEKEALKKIRTFIESGVIK